MPASVNDKVTDVRNAARPNSARATGTRAAGGTSLACDNLAGWPTASKVHFVTYQIDSNSNVVAGTQLDCYGIVSSNTITSFTVVDGNDTGNQVGDVVEMLPTAAWGQDLADALTAQHTRTGTHTGVTTDTIATTGNATVGGTLGVTGTATHSGATVLTGAVSGAGYSQATISNPYKFSVYLNADQSVSSSVATKVTLNTELFDTSNSFDSVTNYRYVAPVNGFYCITTQLGLSAAGLTSGVATEAYLYKNGSLYITGDKIDGSGSASRIPRTTITTLIQLTAGDYLELWGALFEGGRAFNGGTAPMVTYMQGFFVSAT